MMQEVRCPHCGQPVPIPPPDGGDHSPGVIDVVGTAFAPPGGSDADHEVVPLPPVEPGEGAPRVERPPVVDGRAWPGGLDGGPDLLRTPDPDTAFSRFAWTTEGLAGGESPADEIPTIELGQGHVSDALIEASRRWEASVQSGSDLALDGSTAPARAPVWLVLLFSYASAMTLACGWLLWQARQSRGGGREAPRETIAASAPDRDGQRGALSTRIESLATLKENHIVNLEQSLRVGELEIVPRSVKVESLRLERSNLTGQEESRAGLSGTLVLRLELTNRSKDGVFAPLDEAFVRQTDAGPPLGFVEGKDGVRVYLYPLAETDEWGLAGQRFNTLRPGERVETLVATDEEALRRLGEGPYLWRLRLRVGADSGSVEDIGVRMTREQIR